MAAESRTTDKGFRYLATLRHGTGRMIVGLCVTVLAFGLLGGARELRDAADEQTAQAQLSREANLGDVLPPQFDLLLSEMTIDRLGDSQQLLTFASVLVTLAQSLWVAALIIFIWSLLESGLEILHVRSVRPSLRVDVSEATGVIESLQQEAATTTRQLAERREELDRVHVLLDMSQPQIEAVESSLQRGRRSSRWISAVEIALAVVSLAFVITTAFWDWP